MFDIGFWELALILIIALLVVGPERLPALASKFGRWVGQARRMVGNLQRELEREANRNTGGATKAFADARESMREIRDTVDETKNSVADVGKLTDKHFDDKTDQPKQDGANDHG